MIRQKYIEALKTEDGELKKSSTEILDVAFKYYQKLFKKESIDPKVVEHFLENVPVTDQENVHLHR